MSSPSVSRPRATRRFPIRQWLLRIHRWLGLSAGIIFAIAAGTGAVLVYADDLDVLLAGPRFDTTPGSVAPAAIQEAVARHAPGARLLRVIWPHGEPNIIQVRVMAEGRNRDLVLDGGSGALLEPRPQHVLLVAIRRLHAGLLIGPVGGRIVLVASAATVVSLALGAVLWWPGIRRLGSGLRLRARRGVYAASLDLHQTLGILALPVLLVMTVTGVLIDPATMRVASRLLHGGDATASWRQLRSASASGPDVDLATAVLTARAAQGDDALVQVLYPLRADGTVEVRLWAAPGASSRVALDRSTGAVLLRQHLRYDPETNVRLHFGQSYGAAVRVLYAAACVVGFSLLPTGAALWWLKRRRSRLPAPPVAA